MIFVWPFYMSCPIKLSTKLYKRILVIVHACSLPKTFINFLIHFLTVILCFYSDILNFLKVTLNFVKNLHAISKKPAEIFWIFLRNIYIAMNICASFTETNINATQYAHSHALKLHVILSVLFHRMIVHIFYSICCWPLNCLRD